MSLYGHLVNTLYKQLYGRMVHPVGKCYDINIEAEKLTFSIGENPEDGRERFTFSNSCDMMKKRR